MTLPQFDELPSWLHLGNVPRFRAFSERHASLQRLGIKRSTLGTWGISKTQLSQLESESPLAFESRSDTLVGSLYLS